MAYTFEGDDLKPEIYYNSSSDTLTFWPKVDGENVTCTSSTVTLYDYAGTELVASQSATITAVSGQSKLTVALDTTTTANYPLEEDFFAAWVFISSGVSHTYRQFFDIVRRKLRSLISLNDLLEEYPWLDDSLTRLGDSTGKRSIYRAWVELNQKLRSQIQIDGKVRPALIIDDYMLKPAHLHMALARIFRTLAKSETDAHWLRYIEHRDLADNFFRALGPLKYDEAEVGYAGGSNQTIPGHPFKYV